jgi:hypothetical protein
MKNKNIAAALLLCSLAAPMHAQVYKDTSKTPKERFSQLLGETKKGMEKAGKTISDFFGGIAAKDSDEVMIDGVKYMRIHSVNLFEGDDSAMLTLCREDFIRRYPNTTIVSVAIPQASWTETALKEKGKIVAYRRVAQCFVLAKDGTDGYINARYGFRCSRTPGKKWVKPAEYWPKFERADAIPNVHFRQLNKE